MSTRSLVNLALLVIALLLLAVSIFEPGHRAGKPPVRLLVLDPAAVTRIRIQRPNTPGVELVKKDRLWRMVTPFDLPANGFRAAALAQIATATSTRHFSAAHIEPARFGLATPRAILRLDGHRFAFGDTEPISGRRYVQVGGTVYLTDDVYLQEVATAPASFVYPGPLGPDPKPTEIDLPGVHLRLVHGSWQMQPDRPQIGADALVALVDAWRGAQAPIIRTYDARRSSEGEITVVLAGHAQPLHFTLSRAPREIVLGRPERGVEYHFPQQAGERLLTLGEEDGRDTPATGQPGRTASHE